MSAHTPGPWEFDVTRSGRIKIYAPALVVGDDWSKGWVAAPSSQQGPKTRVANARLIAAAPHLLDRVRARLRACKCTSSKGRACRNCEQDVEAIHKAGETP